MQPGITMQTLGGQIGVSQSSISRNVQTLGKWRRMGKPGYDLVTAVDDPVDTRRKNVFLTRDGNALAASCSRSCTAKLRRR
jgi:DNA-binding MarR family transcriptional regulator